MKGFLSHDILSFEITPHLSFALILLPCPEITLAHMNPFIVRMDTILSCPLWRKKRLIMPPLLLILFKRLKVPELFVFSLRHLACCVCDLQNFLHVGSQTNNLNCQSPWFSASLSLYPLQKKNTHGLYRVHLLCKLCAMQEKN